jgi:hypothetical protein
MAGWRGRYSNLVRLEAQFERDLSSARSQIGKDAGNLVEGSDGGPERVWRWRGLSFGFISCREASQTSQISHHRRNSNIHRRTATMRNMQMRSRSTVNSLFPRRSYSKSHPVRRKQMYKYSPRSQRQKANTHILQTKETAAHHYSKPVIQ